MRIALLGTAPSSRLLAPFKDPSWEIWACSPDNMDLPRIDVFFEIHALETTLREPQYAAFVAWCKRHPKIYMQEQFPDFPGSIKYPFQDMRAKFGNYFWTSSLAYMQALAIDTIQKRNDPENHIGLWGVDMSASDEYQHQRPGCHFFIQEALRAGIKIAVPPESDLLFPPPPYGYREADPMWWKMNTRWKELHAKYQQMLREQSELQRQIQTFEGAMDDAQYVCNTFYMEKSNGTS